MGLPIALVILALVWLGSKRPKFRSLAIFGFTLECVLFREDALILGDPGFWIIVAMLVIAFIFWFQDKIVKNKRPDGFAKGIIPLI